MQGSSQPSFAINEKNVALQGRWRLSDLQNIKLDELSKLKNLPEITFDCSKLESIDTGSLRLIFSKLRGSKFGFVNTNEKMEEIFELVLKSEKNLPEPERIDRPFLTALGKGIYDGTASWLVLLKFIGQTVIEQFKSIFTPRQIRIKELFVQLEQCGLNAVPVVALVMFLIGTVVAYLFASQIEKYGANIFIVDGVTIAICRELSPVIVAIIVAGRSGSAFTAQLGTMKLNEEVDALSTLGLSPMRVLILPRFTALIVCLPILVAVGDLIGILGGLIVSDFRLGIMPDTFLQRTQEVLKIKHVWVGLFKAPVFAAFIAIIGCKMGLTVENNARSVGLSTTSTVVQSIVSVILLNAGFAVLFVELGI
jgi:phospholipid/cholesterol/gamma-HCH transport system permease protein